MKQGARESFIKGLTKACKDEDINIELDSLSDKTLKSLYLALQQVRRGAVPYGVPKGKDFKTEMENGRLPFVTFRGTYSLGLGLRRITFNEYLLLLEFVSKNPSMYRFLGTK